MTVKEKKKVGRPPTLTPEEIIATIIQMQKDGDKVTPSTIKGRLNYGGLSNIRSVLDNFIEEQNQTDVSIAEFIENHVLSPELEDITNSCISDFTQKIISFSLESDLLANKMAKKKARSAYETMIDDNRKLLDEQTCIIKLFDEVEVKNHELNEQISETEIKLQNEKSNVMALNTSLDKANNEVTRLKQLLSEKEAILSTLETKNLSHEKLITKIETRLEDSLKDKEISTNESIKIRTQLTETSSKLMTSEESISQLKSDMNTLKTDKDKVISEVQSKNSVLSSKLQANQSKHQIDKEQLITITTQFSAQKDFLKEKNERITDLKNQLTELKTTK
jgi:chromosome segregation ATPase